MSIIEVKNLSKYYRINQVCRSTTLRDKVLRGAKDLSCNFDNTEFSKKEIFWALKDVSFRVDRGRVLGIIGPNGAGKSTLLKVLSRITLPTKGYVKVMGKVASLLEVGTGFHPELSGRENIYINGAILGMKRREINREIDSIINFSGVEKFIDNPVKYYSSGMQVRLAFSVAAHLNPDILLIDEVLAVGDMAFQKKCYEKINEITENSGKTILFVSHNINAVRKLCNDCVLLENGRIREIGATEKIVSLYFNSIFKQEHFLRHDSNNKKIKINDIKIVDCRGKKKDKFFSNEPFVIEIRYSISEHIFKNNYVFISFYDDFNNLIFTTYDIDSNEKYYKKRDRGFYKSIFEFPPHVFNQKIYKLTVGCGIPPKYNNDCQRKNDYYDIVDNLFIAFIGDHSFSNKFFRGQRDGGVLPKISSKIIKI